MVRLRYLAQARLTRPKIALSKSQEKAKISFALLKKPIILLDTHFLLPLCYFSCHCEAHEVQRSNPHKSNGLPRFAFGKSRNDETQIHALKLIFHTCGLSFADFKKAL